jgi:hypothetical protein
VDLSHAIDEFINDRRPTANRGRLKMIQHCVLLMNDPVNSRCANPFREDNSTAIFKRRGSMNVSEQWSAGSFHDSSRRIRTVLSSIRPPAKATPIVHPDRELVSHALNVSESW